MASKPPPFIPDLASKTATLERRRLHLERRLARADYNSSQSADFDKAEAAALADMLVLARWRMAVRP